jgi:hypothetical protein
VAADPAAEQHVPAVAVDGHRFVVEEPLHVIRQTGKANVAIISDRIKDSCKIPIALDLSTIR